VKLGVYGISLDNVYIFNPLFRDEWPISEQRQRLN
jgi:hypothetical protein